MPAVLQSPPPGATATERILCPVCGGKGVPHVRTRLTQDTADCCTIRACPDCSHQWASLTVSPEHIEQNYSIDYFEGGGAGYSDYFAEAELLRRHGQAYGKILTKLAPRQGTLLDVGAAAGFIANGFCDSGWQTTALEPNREMAEYAGKQLGLRVHRGSLEDNRLAGTFDAVAMIQVLAHFSDPRTALAQAARLTKPGGIWLIETWNSNSLCARFLGKHWHEYSPPSALHYFTERSLQTLAAEFGFEPVASGRPDKRISIGHALSLLSYRMGNPPWMAWAKNASATFTVPYPGDDIFWAAFRRRS